MIASIGLAACCAAVLQQVVERPRIPDWPLVAFDGVANGDFEDALSEDIERLSWWQTLAGVPRIEDGVLVLPPGAAVLQPLASADGIGLDATLTVEGSGPVSVTLIGADGTTRVHHLMLESEHPFVVSGPELHGEASARIAPRSGVRIETRSNAPSAGRVDRIQLSTTWPAPTSSELRAHLRDVLVWSLDEWLDRSLDVYGTRETAFVATLFDAFTGEPVGEPAARATLHPVYTQLLDLRGALDADDVALPRIDAALARFLDDFLELGLHPATGLPRFYDPVRDRAIDAEPIEIGAHLRFLADVADFGPEAQRERALDAGLAIGEVVLQRGLLPDGSIAAKYWPEDGRPETAVVDLRRLDVPAALARFVALARDAGRDIDDRRYVDAIGEALRSFSFDAYWPGDWEHIDPGFDDQYGHFGARAATIWRALPELTAAREIARSGLDVYAPMWRDALRFGGNIAADQVRCWEIALDIVELEPALGPEVDALLNAAVAAHLMGGQDGAGVWVDVTIVGFNPQRLPVGDTAGVPHNLIKGLARSYSRSGTAADRLRAQFAGVCKRTELSFAGPHGWIARGQRRPGTPAPAIGSLQLHAGLIEMLAAL